jgi:hypothetical protein
VIAYTWDKLKAICGRSLTIASGYASLVAGGLLGNIDAIAETLGDPQLHDQIQSLIGHNPSIAAGYAKAYGILMIAARLRSKIIKQKA